MDEQQLNEILTSYRDAINALIERMDAQDEMVKAAVEKVDGLNHLVFDEVINPAKEAMEESIYNKNVSEFGNKYSDKFAGYNEKLKPIEGEDFDIVKQAYDGYNEIEGEKPDEALYVDELIKAVDKQLDDIRTAIGAPEDTEITVNDKDGETVVEIDGKEVDAESIDAESIEAEPKAEDTESEDTESSEEELAKYEKELLAMVK